MSLNQNVIAKFDLRNTIQNFISDERLIQRYQMKYLPTPMNIAAVILIITAIYSYITAPEGGDGLQNFWVLPIIGVAILILIIDYFLQLYTPHFWRLVWIQGLVLFVIIVVPMLVARGQTFIIPSQFTEGYIVLIYGVEGGPKISSNALFGKSIGVPEDGIVWTSSKFKPGYISSKLKDDKGKSHNVNASNIRMLQFDENQMNCNGKTYNYVS